MQASSCLVTAPPATSCRCSRLPAAAATSKASTANGSTTTCTAASTTRSYEGQIMSSRRGALRTASAAAAAAAALFVLVCRPPAALAAEDEEYVKDTSDVIKKVRSTIEMDKSDPNVASAVAELRDASNYWVAKYRREKDLLGRPSFRDMYSALNAVSGHYISFGPTAPIPAKRRTRILEEVDTAEKALLRGR